MQAAPPLPANPFYAAPEQRAMLARQRFFEEGVRPSGVVSEAVIQSWGRCLRTHPNPNQAAVFEPVSVSRVHSVLRSNQELLAAADTEMQRLRETLAGTTGTAILTDAQGVIIGSSFTQARGHERLMPITTRIGVNLAEEVVGTTAPGITARTGQASVVQGSEHFFANVVSMHCAAAPIRDVRGQLAGVLDLSSEGIPFGFDAATVVAHFAAEIENRWLCAQSHQHLVVRLQITPALLDTPLAALIGVKADGRIDWLNGAAARFLDQPGLRSRCLGAGVEDWLGVSSERLFAMSTGQGAQQLHLPNGLTLWARFEWRSTDGPRGGPRMPHGRTSRASHNTSSAGAAPPSGLAPQPPAPATLRETEHQAVVRVLHECAGNVSQAARALGVSRGLIYRHLRGAFKPVA